MKNLNLRYKNDLSNIAKTFGIVCAIIILASDIFGQQLPKFKVNGIEIVGKTAARTEKMKRAAAIFEKVMNDIDFQKELKGKIFKSDTNDDDFKNFTTEQIIQKIYAAGEEYKVDTDNTADIYWYAEKKSWWKRQRDPKCLNIGYGYPGKKGIYTYTCFIDDDDLMGKLVGHVAHEWSHKVGFVHDKKDHNERRLTVPYTFGDLVAKYAEKYV